MTYERKLLDDLVCGLLVQDQWEDGRATAMLAGDATHVTERAVTLAGCAGEHLPGEGTYYAIDGAEVEVDESDGYTFVSVAMVL